jgi:tRNA pseudouridine38-40 synthase
MRNIKLILQYDGTGYSGWQSQKQGERTVQDVLEDRIGRITGEAARVVGAGRTDAGVHALGQAAHFRTSSSLDAATMQSALNAMLPGDIRVVSAEEVGGNFHPQYDTLGKRYVYLIANMQYTPPFLRRYVWRVPPKLDLRAMRRAAGHFRGRQDFRAFMGSGSGVKGTVREVGAVVVRSSGSMGFLGFALRGRFVRVSVEGSGFLRHMVRNIVGTLIEVAKGRLDADSIPGIIASGDRGLAGPTAPAMGLFLEKVFYLKGISSRDASSSFSRSS